MRSPSDPVTNSTHRNLCLQLLDKCLSFVEEQFLIANFFTASTAATESICVLGALGSDVSSFTKTSKSELVSMLDPIDKIKFSS